LKSDLDSPPQREILWTKYSDAEKRRLGCLRDAAGSNAGCANANVHARAIDHGADPLEIGIPATAAGIVRVAHHIPERRPLAANFAFLCHNDSSPTSAKMNKRCSLTEFFYFRTEFHGAELIPWHDSLKGGPVLFQPRQIRLTITVSPSNRLIAFIGCRESCRRWRIRQTSADTIPGPRRRRAMLIRLLMLKWRR
jgi:hypothetical protein